MPYLDEERREHVITNGPTQVGDLNFIFSSSIAFYLEEHGLSYGTINAVVGALECAKIEFYRRIAAPYEDKKIKENGDVYDT